MVQVSRTAIGFWRSALRQGGWHLGNRLHHGRTNGWTAFVSRWFRSWLTFCHLKSSWSSSRIPARRILQKHQIPRPQVSRYSQSGNPGGEIRSRYERCRNRFHETNAPNGSLLKNNSKRSYPARMVPKFERKRPRVCGWRRWGGFKYWSWPDWIGVKWLDYSRKQTNYISWDGQSK